MEIRTRDASGKDLSVTRVPIAYGPVQKFLARLEQRPDLRGNVSTLTLPRMSFEMTGISYDAQRKITNMQSFNSKLTTSGKLSRNFMPVPYNINMQLNILAKLNEDALQIVEQILPYFQPSFNITVNLVESLGEKRDIPIVLENLSFDDNYEEDYLTRRNITYTLNFVCKTYLFGPITNTSEGLIKQVQVDYQTQTKNLKTGSRQLRYVATPVAVKDYDNDQTTTTGETINDKVTAFKLSDNAQLPLNSFIEIDEEIMKVKSKDGNQTITVLRGQYGTSIVPHDIGIPVNAITVQDNSMIDLGDDFGFSESTFDFDDGKIYSTTKGTDV
tara:strand:- start:1117 stop:2103 length:987 start_codon:yes stop_codon:yes gene_type:complete